MQVITVLLGHHYQMRPSMLVQQGRTLTTITWLMLENALTVQEDSHVRQGLEGYKNHLRNVLKVMHYNSLQIKSLLTNICNFVLVYSIWQELRGRGYSTKFYMGRLRSPTSYPFVYLFDRKSEKVPFCIPLISYFHNLLILWINCLKEVFLPVVPSNWNDTAMIFAAVSIYRVHLPSTSSGWRQGHCFRCNVSCKKQYQILVSAGNTSRVLNRQANMAVSTC